MEHKSLEFEVKEVSEDGHFEGYASTFGNVDSDMDIIERGAFSDSLAKYKSKAKLPKLLWQHNPQEVIGVYEEMREDDRGLYVKGRLLKDVSKGREAYALLSAGAMDGMSIGFQTIEAIFEGASNSIRKILKVDLWEVSLVTWGANPEALVTDVKGVKTERDFERFLRDSGYSRKEATAIALHGFKAIDAQRDADATEAETDSLKAILTSLDELKGKFNA